MLRRIRELLERRHDFAIETTLSGRSRLKLFLTGKRGVRLYRNGTFHLGQSSASLRSAGESSSSPRRSPHSRRHDLPRYARSIENFVGEYRHHANRLALYEDTITNRTKLTAEKSSEGLVIHDAETWELLVKGNDDDR